MDVKLSFEATGIIGRYSLLVDDVAVALVEPGNQRPLMTRTPCCGDTVRSSTDGPSCRRCWNPLTLLASVPVYAALDDAQSWLPSILILTHAFYESVLVGWALAEVLPEVFEELSAANWLPQQTLPGHLETLTRTVTVD